MKELILNDLQGTNYKRTVAVAEILRTQRESFWAQAEVQKSSLFITLLHYITFFIIEIV